MTFLSIYLIIYIISIFWCKWALKIIIDEGDRDYIFSKEFIIKFVSWIPALNLFMAVISTKEILEDKYRTWKTIRQVKRILKRISENHKDEPVSDELNKIISNL